MKKYLSYEERLAEYNREQARIQQMIDRTASHLIRRIRTETPSANDSLFEQWEGAFHLSLKYADNPQALAFSQAMYRQLHAANYP